MTGQSSPLPLSFGQERLWFLERLHGPSSRYNVPVLVTLRGTLHREALSAAFGDVVDRHEILRTTFAEAGGAPYQRIAPPGTGRPLVEVVGAGEDQVDALVETAARQTFDLATGPLMRVWLFVVGPADHRLLVLLHHCVADGQSIGPLLHDLAVAYRARIADVAPEWDELPVQYADYAAWQRELLGDDRDPTSLSARQLAFWRQTLRDAPGGLALPVARPRPAEPSGLGGIVRFTVDAATHQRLADLAVVTRASPYMIVHATLVAALARAGGHADIVVGVPVAGRPDTMLEHLVGFFVNTLAVRVDAAGDSSFRTLVHQVRGALLAAQAHQDVPFERVVEAVNPERVAGRHPLFQAALTVQDEDVAVPQLPGLIAQVVAVHTGTTKFDLTFALTQSRDRDGRPGGLDGAVEYAADLFDRPGAQWLAGCWQQVLQHAAADPDVPLSRLRMPPVPSAHPPALPSRPDLLHLRPGPARPELERILLSLFADALGTTAIDADTSFFDAGGHSLLAARILSAARHATGLRIEMWQLFAAPSAGLLARLVSRTAAPAHGGDPSVTVLQAGAGGTPLWCLPPAAGVSTVYRPLLQHLPPDQAVYGLHSRALLDSGAGRFDLVVTDWLADIRRVQATGPYRLLGWSFGGNAAHALAIALQAAGERVELLAILDAHPAPGAADDPVPDTDVRGALLRSVGGGHLVDGHLVDELMPVFAGNLALLQQSTTGVFRGDVVVVAATRSPLFDPRAWDRHVDGAIRLERVDCVHGELLGPAGAAAAGRVLRHRLQALGPSTAERRAATSGG